MASVERRQKWYLQSLVNVDYYNNTLEVWEPMVEVRGLCIMNGVFV